MPDTRDFCDRAAKEAVKKLKLKISLREEHELAAIFRRALHAAFTYTSRWK